MEEKEITPQQSLDLIQSMIGNAKNTLADNGFLFIFWGWLVFVAACAFYYLTITRFENPWYAWETMPLGGIFTMIYSFRKQKKDKVKSYIDTYMAYVWIAFAICLTLTIVMGFKLQLSCYPVIIMLYATGTFITGGILRFKPLVVCGLLSYAISAVAFFVSFETQILLLALSVLVSYIIPGHLLYKEFKSQQNV